MTWRFLLCALSARFHEYERAPRYSMRNTAEGRLITVKIWPCVHCTHWKVEQ